MQPQRSRGGVPTLSEARRPTDEDIYNPQNGQWHAESLQLPAVDPEADEALAAKLPRVKAAKAVKALPATASPTLRRRKLTQLALALRAEGASVNEIAAELGVSSVTVTGWFTTHRREISTDKIDAMLDQIAVPLATENLMHGLLAGDKQYTLETLKGRGHLRQKDAPAPPAELPALRIEFAFPVVALQTDLSTVGMIHATPITPKLVGAGKGEEAEPDTIDATPVGIGVPRGAQ